MAASPYPHNQGTRARALWSRERAGSESRIPPQCSPEKGSSPVSRICLPQPLCPVAGELDRDTLKGLFSIQTMGVQPRWAASGSSPSLPPCSPKPLTLANASCCWGLKSPIRPLMVPAGAGVAGCRRARSLPAATWPRSRRLVLSGAQMLAPPQRGQRQPCPAPKGSCLPSRCFAGGGQEAPYPGQGGDPLRRGPGARTRGEGSRRCYLQASSSQGLLQVPAW